METRMCGAQNNPTGLFTRPDHVALGPEGCAQVQHQSGEGMPAHQHGAQEDVEDIPEEEEGAHAPVQRAERGPPALHLRRPVAPAAGLCDDCTSKRI